jgi:glycosyltransferase involved in cell wall biosynthesis
VSALVPYKRIEIAVEACRRVGADLTVVGRGPELANLQRLAGGNVRFAGWQDDEAVRDLYRRAKAVLLPGIEDFGMVPVEAQACGTPVVALARGGSAETTRDGVTGVLVDAPTAEAFADGLKRVAALPRNTQAIRANAERFSRERFMTAFEAAVEDAIADRKAVTW